MNLWQKTWRILCTLTLAVALVGLSPEPASAKRKTHTVVKGETLSRIAARYGIRVRSLKRINRLKEDRIVIGQRLRLPKNARMSAPALKRQKTRTSISSASAAPTRPIIIINPAPE